MQDGRDFVIFRNHQDHKDIVKDVPASLRRFAFQPSLMVLFPEKTMNMSRPFRNALLQCHESN